MFIFRGRNLDRIKWNTIRLPFLFAFHIRFVLFFLFERVHRKAKTGLDADRFDLVQSKLLFFLLKKRKRIAAVSIKNLMPALKFETTAAAANNNRRPFSFVCFFLFRFRFQWPNPIAADAILLSQTTYDDYRSTKRRSRFSLGQFFCFFF